MNSAITLDNSILLRVEKPARYTGGEYNSCQKFRKIDIKSAVSWLLAFPDVYDIGMSNLGMKILYDKINGLDEAWADRVYVPWVDMEKLMRDYNIPLFALESRYSAADFDIIGISLPYEMCYSNILNLLDLAGMPIRAQSRDDFFPIVLGGGTCVANCEPVADFFDCFFFGEAENMLPEINRVVYNFKLTGQDNKKTLLEELSKLSGVYVPRFYDYNLKNNSLSKNNILAPNEIKRQWVSNFTDISIIEKPIIPNIETVHDRITLEIFRGCTRGCRFCQAGILYRPVRERTVEKIVEQAKTQYMNTGYDEISLLSLSSADYSNIDNLISVLQNTFCKSRVNIALPSLRTDSLSKEIADKLQAVRKGGLTLAPEAGSQRLRDVINKGISEEDILSAALTAFDAGCKTVKLYFMIGLPTETDEDVLAIAKLAKTICRLYDANKNNRDLRVKISLSNFVPKAHTPFQRLGQEDSCSLRAKQNFLLQAIKSERRITLNWHDVEVSFWEAVLARGDRQLSEVIELAWRKGAKFDSWTDKFSNAIWRAACAECDITPENIACRYFDDDEVLPWSLMSSGVTDDFLCDEYKKAMECKTTSDCRWYECLQCGVLCR